MFGYAIKFYNATKIESITVYFPKQFLAIQKISQYTFNLISPVGLITTRFYWFSNILKKIIPFGPI